jgi:Domain of unknown function (DUF4326)
VTKTRVVNIKSGEPFDVYIGRQTSPKMSPTGRSLRRSIWANPFRGEAAVEKFEHYLLEGEGSFLLDNLPDVRGKVLGCWCKPKPCHGDAIARLADERVS